MANRRNTNSTNDINNTYSTPTVVTSNGRHPVYHGIRRRADKWVSEIRNNSSRIWLGTYPTPEMAAAAYDAAALVLKGSYALLNFPDSVLSDSGTLPECPTVDDIRAAAATAAAARHHMSNDHESEVETTVTSPSHGELMDHDTAVFDSMPNMLSYMAEGMMMSPPRISSNYYLPAEQGDSSGGGWNLWSY